MQIYVGGYGSRSLSLCEFDRASCKARILESYDIENASYICMSKNKNNLYSVIEKSNYQNRSGGGVASFKLQPDGSLKFSGELFTEGAAPCHLSLNDAEDTLYIANYSDGSLSIFTVNKSGDINKLSRKIDNASFGVASNAVPERQDSPHAHFIAPHLGRLWVCDLGMDRVFIFDDFNTIPKEIYIKPGSGPRHFAFHPEKPISYLVCELSGEIATINESGEILSYTHTLQVTDSKNTSAAIRVSPDGGFVLVSNRGADCISVLQTSRKNMKNENKKNDIPELIGIYQSGGRCPRDFAFSSFGNIIACANQESDNISFFEWNEKKGCLSEKIESLEVQKPTCVLFA